MFALLGEIPFRVVGSPDSFESQRSYDYAEHRVVEARPRRQWLARGLETIELEMMLHRAFTDPSVQYARLRAAADTHRAMALVFGSGEFRGYFVIESISSRSTQHSASGAPIALTLRVRLREWVKDRDRAARASARPLGLIETGRAAEGAVRAAAAAPIGRSELAPAPIPADAGVSALLRLLGVAGLPSVSLRASDVATATITRRGSA
ncbi:MAG: phage tail protein [Candidatus Binataceae bacterium]